MKVENGELETGSWKSFSFQLSPFSCIIQLEMGTYDYSLTEIARIVEENDAKILGLTVDKTVEQSCKVFIAITIT